MSLSKQSTQHEQYYDVIKDKLMTKTEYIPKLHIYTVMVAGKTVPLSTMLSFINQHHNSKYYDF